MCCCGSLRLPPVRSLRLVFSWKPIWWSAGPIKHTMASLCFPTCVLLHTALCPSQTRFLFLPLNWLRCAVHSPHFSSLSLTCSIPSKLFNFDVQSGTWGCSKQASCIKLDFKWQMTQIYVFHKGIYSFNRLQKCGGTHFFPSLSLSLYNHFSVSFLFLLLFPICLIIHAVSPSSSFLSSFSSFLYIAWTVSPQGPISSYSGAFN